ncbi:MAG TPA: RNA polymerase sigma factor [Rhodanobacteraceae bacterium]|nr:RNA polymerase sigma factor [Rhodanobacteraceae bacterium]
MPGAEDLAQPQAQSMDAFLASVERPGFRSAQLALGNPDDALDAVQDAMMRLSQSYAKRPAEEWKPLFWSILRRRITDMHRRRKVRSVVVGWLQGTPDPGGDAPPPWEPADQGPGPAQQLEDAKAMERLGEALRALPRRQREAFTLRTLNGLDGAATAAAMGCSEGSVKTHLSRAMHALRDEMKDWQ